MECTCKGSDEMCPCQNKAPKRPTVDDLLAVARDDEADTISTVLGRWLEGEA